MRVERLLVLSSRIFFPEYYANLMCVFGGFRVKNGDVATEKFWGGLVKHFGGFALNLVVFPKVKGFYNSKAFIWGALSPLSPLSPS